MKDDPREYVHGSRQERGARDAVGTEEMNRHGGEELYVRRQRDWQPELIFNK